MPTSSAAPAIAADLVTAAELDHEDARELSAPAIATDLVTPPPSSTTSMPASSAAPAIADLVASRRVRARAGPPGM